MRFTLSNIEMYSIKLVALFNTLYNRSETNELIPPSEALCLVMIIFHPIHVPNSELLFLLLRQNSIPLCVGTTLSLSVHLLIDKHVDSINWAPMTMEVQTSIQYVDFRSFEYVPRSGVVGHMVILFLAIWEP